MSIRLGVMVVGLHWLNSVTLHSSFQLLFSRWIFMSSDRNVQKTIKLFMLLCEGCTIMTKK